MTAITALAHCTDTASIQSALHGLCSVFGPVSQMNILSTSDNGKRHAVCFFRLAAPEQEQRMMLDLGVQRFGNEMFVVVDLAN